MSHSIYKKIEIIGTSGESVEAAIDNAVARAGESVRHLRWFEVDEIRGSIEDGKVSEWQVGLKIGFTLDG